MTLHTPFPWFGSDASNPSVLPRDALGVLGAAGRHGQQSGVLPEEGVLYLSVLDSRTETRLREVVVELGHESTEPYANVLAIRFGSGELEGLSTSLEEQTSDDEQREIKCRCVVSDVVPPPSELMQTRSLGDLIAAVRGQWLFDVVRQRRLVTHFQPIVRTNQPSEIFAYECLVRGTHADGSLIPPVELFSAARATGGLLLLDHAACLTAIDAAARHKLQTTIFVNFNPSSIYDPDSCLKGVVEYVCRSGIRPEQFVFEVVESEDVRDADRLLEILDGYRRAGFRVALDDVGAGYNSLNLLTKLQPDFIKVDMELIRNVHVDPYKDQVVSMLLELSRGLGVSTVVEGIENDGEWRWSIEHGADYAQGFLFAKPAGIPPIPGVKLANSHNDTDSAGETQIG